MDLDGAMDEALRGGPDALAIACADVHAGFVLGAAAHGEAEREAATTAAACAAQLCAMPRVGEQGVDDDEEALGGDEIDASEALVVSSRWIHAFARVAKRPDLVVVGVARGDANVALVRDWVKRVAGGLNRDVDEPEALV